MSLLKFLDKCSTAYYAGEPIISDEQFDYLADLCGYGKVGATPNKSVAKHTVPMYSLQKYYVGEGTQPLQEFTSGKVNTPKLDGAAISAYYVHGQLVQVLTRGDGVEGQNITDKFVGNEKSFLPTQLDTQIAEEPFIQITGEIVTYKEVPNARNYAAGALNLNSIDEFNERTLMFVAYGTYPKLTESYTKDLDILGILGFHTVKDEDFCDQFPQDGRVVRLDSYKEFEKLGYTSKHPRGAYAIKERKEGVVTKLVDVVWQTGKTGRVTPVAILTPVVLGGATVSRATLNNPGFIKALGLSIGDLVEVQRAGEIIPTIIRKVETSKSDEDNE